MKQLPAIDDLATRRFVDGPLQLADLLRRKLERVFAFGHEHRDGYTIRRYPDRQLDAAVLRVTRAV